MTTSEILELVKTNPCYLDLDGTDGPMSACDMLASAQNGHRLIFSGSPATYMVMCLALGHALFNSSMMSGAAVRSAMQSSPDELDKNFLRSLCETRYAG